MKKCKNVENFGSGSYYTKTMRLHSLVSSTLIVANLCSNTCIMKLQVTIIHVYWLRFVFSQKNDKTVALFRFSCHFCLFGYMMESYVVVVQDGRQKCGIFALVVFQ